MTRSHKTIAPPAKSGTAVAVDKIEFATTKGPLGVVLVARSARGICAILLGDRAAALEADLRIRFPVARFRRDESALRQILSQVTAFIERPERGFDLPLDIRGTDFQCKVWKALREIPVGTTASYTDIARRIGAPRSMRAVALACAANPLAVAIPCHRVVRQSGALSGYRWGAERKQVLLGLEARG